MTKIQITKKLSIMLILQLIFTMVIVLGPSQSGVALPVSFTSTIFTASGTSSSHGVAVDSSGIVWWTDRGSPGAIVRQDPSFAPGDPTGTTIFALPSPLSNPITNQVDSAGNIWFGTSNNYIGKLDPTGPTFTAFGQLPSSCTFPDQLAFDAAGDVWFDCLTSASIGKLNVGTGTFDLFPTPTTSSGPSGITVDFTGIVWSIERSGDNVVRLDPALAIPGTSIGVTEFAVPTSPSAPETVKVCGNEVWFTELTRFNGAAQIGFLDKNTNAITEFTVDTSGSGGTYGLIIDGGGNPWVTNPNTPKIYGFDTSTNTATTFVTPTTPHHIALSPSGDLWYSDSQGEIVRMTPSVPLQPACAPLESPAEPRSKGYWKNHQEETEAHLGPSMTIGLLAVIDFETAQNVFNGNARNMNDILAAHLLATEINLWNGVTSCQEVIDAVAEAQALLAGDGWVGPGTGTPPLGADRDTAETLKDILDTFNSDGCSE